MEPGRSAILILLSRLGCSAWGSMEWAGVAWVNRTTDSIGHPEALELGVN